MCTTSSIDCEGLTEPYDRFYAHRQIQMCNFHSRTVHLDIIKVFTPTDAQVFKKEY